MLHNFEFTTMGALKRNVTTSPGPVRPAIDPLYNKYVIIGGLIFFAVVLLVAIIVHLMRGYRKHACQDDSIKRLYGRTEESDDPLTGEDDDDLDDLYTSCHLYVEDLEVNTASSDFEYDSRSVDGGVSDVMLQTNPPRESVDAQTEALEKSRLLLTRHFKM